MGNGYTPGRPDDMAQMRALIEGLNRRITDLEKPMGGLQQRPPTAATVQGWAQGYAVPTSSTVVVSTVLTVPTGYTQCILTVTAAAEFANGTASTVEVYTNIDAVSTSGTATGNAPGLNVPVTAGATNSMTAVLAYIFTGISPTGGQTITVSGLVASGTALSANAFNACGLAGVAQFFA